MQLFVLIRAIAEYYRLRYAYGPGAALIRYEPYIGGLLIDAVLCLAAVLLIFYRKYSAAVLVSAATVVVLLIYKIVEINRW